MSLYDYIWKRKSTHNYDMTPLEPKQLEQILQFTKVLKPLYPGIKTTYRIAPDIKNILPVKAPHYIFIYSDKIKGYLENAGFIFQQLDLFFLSLNLGSCWLGMGKPVGYE